MDRKSTSLFDVVAEGDESTLQRLLLEAKEERNIATLAVSLNHQASTWITDKLIITQFFSSTATRFSMKQLGMGSVGA